MNILKSTVSCTGGIVLWLIVFSVPALASAADSQRAVIAVASNFTTTARALSSAFGQNSDHTLTLIFGSTGQLYAQILQGAPFDVFLAADQQRPRRLEESDRIVPGSRATYAVGELVLATKKGSGELTNATQRLRTGDYFRLAMANPQLAPYGRAAREVLTSLDALDSAQGKMVLGENVGQVFAMLSTGNVELAFVARAQLIEAANEFTLWLVPATLHQPIRQDLVLLRRAAANSAALAFQQFLSTDQAREIISRHGYRVELD
jgi:molybdenum ABC transporter molybdate-binding protein